MTLSREVYGQNVGGIGNYYGGLQFIQDENKYYWSIGNYDGQSWEEIPEYLYNALDKFNHESGENKK